MLHASRVEPKTSAVRLRLLFGHCESDIDIQGIRRTEKDNHQLFLVLEEQQVTKENLAMLAVRSSSAPTIRRCLPRVSPRSSATPHHQLHARPVSTSTSTISNFNGASTSGRHIRNIVARRQLPVLAKPCFSTTTMASTTTTPAQGGRGYDPEITGMANYVHNHKIESALAVCFVPPFLTSI